LNIFDTPGVSAVPLSFRNLSGNRAPHVESDLFGRAGRVGHRVPSSTAPFEEACARVDEYPQPVGGVAASYGQGRTEHLAGRAQRVRMLGSAAIDLAWVAEGKLDASMTMSNKPWDTAAGVIIAREAGAVVIDQDGSDHTSSSTATIAVAPGVVEELLALVAWTQEEVTELQTRRGA
jgi:myo-inositol-1(or 4)-monophosphatase